MLRMMRIGRAPFHLATSLGGLALVVVAFKRIHAANPTTVALGLLLLVLITAVRSRLWVAVVTAVAAMLALNFFFLPPVGTFTIADPQNWIALFAFLVAAIVTSQLSADAQARAREAIERGQEVTHLFDLSRDVLLTTNAAEAVSLLARFIARRFDLDFAAICLPKAGAWDVFEAGALHVVLDRAELDRAFAGAAEVVEFDAHTRTYSGHRRLHWNGRAVRLVPLRIGTKAVGLLAASGRDIEPATLDALGGVAAIAIERAQFLDERKAAELARQSEELKSALLASLGHDLRTPLTAIRVAANNLQATWLNDDQRREQTALVLAETERLGRLFGNILDMAKIDAGVVAAERRWTDPSEIVDAARAHVEHALRPHRVHVASSGGALVNVDPRLTAAALAHLLENAAQYSPDEAPIEVRTDVAGEGLTLCVRDHGAGIAAADLPRLFDRFFRGAASSRRPSGTGMGLAIARGLLALEHGRIWAENAPDGGAIFTIVVPAETREPSLEAAPV